jgi:hypothetical protein
VSRAPGTLARVDLTGQAGPRTELALRGTVGPLGGPLRVDLSGELGEFAVQRANSYLVRFQCRIAEEALDALADV